MPNNIDSNDRQLTPGDIGVLENADQVTNFFAQFGYDVDNSITLDHAALGMDTTNLRYEIRDIRRVGEDPIDGDIVIYLMEMRSVTVALTQAIARRFRERPENALLVLTKDYESLDFVLVERDYTAGKKLGSGLRQVIRPRTLTVNRRNPTPVDLRVLKRFTFTEADADFQWEKLRSAFTLAEWTEQYFNNRALFSDYYLLERLTDKKLTSAWNEDVRPIGRDVFRHLANARPTYGGKPERDLRRGLYEPLFTSLGFEWVKNKPGDSELDEPDYKLYAPGDSEKPIALAMTYVWNRNLDDMDDGRDKETSSEIPGALVVNILAKAETNWVIVTNGKLWRLYSTTADNKATNYYEIDLEEAVTAPENDQETALKYWWLFFRRQAFEGFLDDLLQQSADYAKGLGERLKDRTFTTIFPHFAEGFVRHGRNNGQTEPDLEAAFSATMTFLYRLMFILYAESLNLLPVTEGRGYGEHSLSGLKKELAEAGGAVEEDAPERLGKRYRADSTELYERLQLLFHAIDQGAEDLNLPMYNGGLFSDDTDEGQFLAEHAIPDRYLALGLDRLCRDIDDKTLALVFIDYKSLGVRQLGSIYEGLLEFKLRVAPEKLVVVKEKGKEVYLPARKAGNKRAVTTLKKGDIYLENDKRERKATGSYYTPDYIVKYIVEHTVGPVLERKTEALAPRLREAQKRYRQHKATVEARGKDQPPELFWNEPDMRQLADDCLDITVLDPAMGSGHFLVEAVDFISDRLIAFLNGWSENPVWGLLERTRQEILADMERQKVSIDAERLTRVALLKRSVLKRCIYGVDLNEMAVELAKVSLWLDAFTLGAPLSFLDHHLRRGNSLIGTDVKTVEKAIQQTDAGQMQLWGGPFAGLLDLTALMIEIAGRADATVADIQKNIDEFDAFEKALKPYKQVLDLWASKYFGNKHAEEFLTLYGDDVLAAVKGNKSVSPQYQEAIEEAQRQWQTRRFFHWDLEFPEIFVDLKQRNWKSSPGFDAVVGNPPWVLGSDKAEFQYETKVFKTIEGKHDTYRLFMESAIDLIKSFGGHGFVVPNTFLSIPSADKLRRSILNQTILRIAVVPFGTFSDVSANIVVYILSKSTPNKESKVIVDDWHNNKTYSSSQIAWANTDGLFSINISDQEQTLIEKVLTRSDELNNCFEYILGMQIYHNTTHSKEEIAKRIHHSDEPQPGYVTELGGTSIQRFFVDISMAASWVKVNSKKAYSLPDSRFFTGPRVIIREIPGADSLIAGYIEETIYTNKSTMIVRSQKNDDRALKFLLAIINSSLSYFLFTKLASKGEQVLFPRLSLTYLRKLPIPYTDNGEDDLTEDICREIKKGNTPLILEFVVQQLGIANTRLIHDLLAYLAEQMIELNKQKQAEVKRFLGWVEEKLGGRGDRPVAATPPVAPTVIDTFTGKTILQNYLGDYQKGEKELPWADFEYRLHQNRNRYPANLAEVKGEIQGEYEKSLAVLLPIKRQLAHTDALIDQIVYKLYGLTDEEIAIIERPAYEQALSEAKADVLKDKKLQKDTEAAVEVMAEKVLPAAQRLAQQVAMPVERASLDKALPGWQLLPDDVATFLLTAEFNLGHLPDHLDFSTSIIAYAKAVETMLYHRLFLRFRAEAGATDADCANKFLQQFMRDEKHLTLGSISIILQSSREAALRAFIEMLYPLAPTTFFSPDGLVDRLTDETNLALRNAAAHDQTLTKDDAKATRQWAFGILQYL